MVARLHAGDTRAHFAHHARALMPQHRWEDTLAVEAVERIGIGVADPRRHDLHQHLARLRALEVQLHDLQRLLRLESDGCTGFHWRLS
ncbi:hypothetical protein ASE00_06905 [Sphingomonas sp. Root710]|nr:hypothetical protein ASE00_06905 [Sphingomonas sp. Root710]